MVQLSNIVKVTEAVAPKELKRFNQLRAVTICGQPGAGLRAGRRARLPGADGTRGAARDGADRRRPARAASTARRGQSLLFVFLLALGFIYLVLAAQFESFRDPLIILLTVPLSMTGALGALWLTGGTLNVYSQIGLVTLVGLITKHGILIVEFANQLQERASDRLDAVIEAAGLRLRPILMTTGAMVLGALPLAHRNRRRRREPPADRLGDRRRHELRHAADAVRRADGLQLPRAGAQSRGGGAAGGCRSRTGRVIARLRRR